MCNELLLWPSKKKNRIRLHLENFDSRLEPDEIPFSYKYIITAIPLIQFHWRIEGKLLKQKPLFFVINLLKAIDYYAMLGRWPKKSFIEFS